jgi:hypothetical protein
MSGIRVYLPTDASGYGAQESASPTPVRIALIQALSMLIMSVRRPLMGTMLVELYDALKEAGASEEKARAAAESLVIGHDRLERIEEHTVKIPKVEDDIARLDKELAVVKAQTDLLKWMNGIVIAGVLALIIKTFFG